MDISTKLHSPFLTRLHPTHLHLKKSTLIPNRRKTPKITARLALETETSQNQSISAEEIESLLSNDTGVDYSKKGKKKAATGASSVSSGVRLENISKSYGGVPLLKDVSWEVRRGEKVGLVGVNGAGKTTQLRIILGLEEPDSGNVIKMKDNMKIAALSQEFEVCGTNTVREEFLSTFKEEVEIRDRLEKVQKVLESSVQDLDLMGRLLDELDLLQRRAQDVNLDEIEVKVKKLMPELGFQEEDADRLVSSFSGGWQMRISLGKIFLQDPDLLLLDEPTNHIDLDTIEWLESYLAEQDVPMVLISHDRAFLDQLCTKIVETDLGVSRTFKGNYSEYVLNKAIWVETQKAAWEKQQKEIEHTKELIGRLGAGVNSGRASSEEKKLEKLKDEGKVEKPFMRKQTKIRFPEKGMSGKTVVMIKDLQFGYGDKVFNFNLIN